MTRNTFRLTRIAGGLVAGVIVLAGCSGGSSDNNASSTDSASSQSSSSASATADFNDADVTFVQGMIPHHESAVEMAKLAEGRAQDPRVLDLASRIEAAQGPEIKTMTGWLADWGKSASAGMSGMDMGGMDMDTSGLKAASGTEFDRMFLTMMTEHHSGAVDMAKTEIADGENADAIALANQISTSQTAEIQEMQTILTSLGS